MQNSVLCIDKDLFLQRNFASNSSQKLILKNNLLSIS